MTGLDAALFDLVNREWASPVLDRILPAFSSFDAWKPVMLAAAVFFGIYGRARGRALLLCLAAGLLLGDSIVSHSLKHLVDRPRPRDVHPGTVVRSLPPEEPRILHVFDPPLVKEVAAASEPGKHGRSFPSSHVLNVFMLATVAFRFHRGAGLTVALGGFLVAWSRVYCGSHWPGDLPASILLGVAVGWTATGFVGWLFRRRGWSGFPESVRQS